MAFPEAVEELASRLGLDVPHEGGSAAAGAQRDSEQLYDLMARVARFYAETLSRDTRAPRVPDTPRPDARHHRAVRHRLRAGLLERGAEALRARARRSAGHSPTSASSSSATAAAPRGAARDGDRHYDRFRDRIMFPDPRRARPRNRLRRPRHRPRRAEIPQLARDGALPQGTRALRAATRPGAPRTNLERLLVVEGYMDAVRLHQSGIPYAVATLGTATTAEHFRRIFQLVREVVFAFDGDRAGRAAAWRALQHALPEAREGREIRFLFLPEGHDPDTLVGAEGREAFERRLESTLPLSEYLVRELSEQVDLTHADGRARFAESARPLVAKVPEGVYRELLTARVAEVVGLDGRAAAGAVGRRRRRQAGPCGADVAGACGWRRRRMRRRRESDGPRARHERRARQPRAPGHRAPGAISRRSPARSSATERAGLDACEEPGASCCASCWTICACARCSASRSSPGALGRQERRGASGRLLEREEVLGDAAGCGPGAQGRPGEARRAGRRAAPAGTRGQDTRGWARPA